MTAALKIALEKEIAFIFNVMQQADIRELEQLTMIDEALEVSKAYRRSFGVIMPEGLIQPEIMLLVWNYCRDELLKISD